ncbi:Rha family transcriptional regulator [Macrococcoides canis]|uniref:Rha family transcriptional regulator n=1 Tax=Macrococcoides canis TaxID=1855823 RepID=UPI00165E79C6|nr:Rha family transcriptional regulator [Macrococcus canis]QNR08268.1 transcriptional regulator [Macrococcus canis]
MNALKVIEQNNEYFVDSREVAEMVEKQHKHLIRDIENYRGVILQSPNLVPEDYFLESTYLAANKRQTKHYLLTKKGCDMVANKMTGEKGILFTAMYVDAFHQMQEHIQQQTMNAPRTQLEAIKMFVQIQEEQQAFNERIQNEVKGIRNIVGIETKNWRNDTNNIIRAIAQHLGGGEQHQKVRAESYKVLEQKGRCNLNQRLANRKGKMLASGATKSQANKLTKLDVITDEPRLIEIYISVVKSMAIKYGIDISQLEI